MNNNNTPDCTNAQQPRLDGHSASSPTLGRAPPREGPPRGMTLSPELVGDAELHRALLSLNITTPRQLRAAVDAPCQLATEAGGSDDARPDADAFAYRGGPCVLNAALELGGHARVRSPELERIMRELVAREPEDATRAARATMDLVLGVLTNRRASRAGPHAARLSSLAPFSTPAEIRRAARFGTLASLAPNLDDAERALADRLAAMDVRRHDDVSSGPRRSSVPASASDPLLPPLFTAPHGVFVPRDDAAHVPEEWTTHIARTLARHARGFSATWGEPERAYSRLLRRADDEAFADDPNCVARADARDAAWGLAIEHIDAAMRDGEGREVASPSVARPRLHVDVHGRRDPSTGGREIGFGDCDVGTAALEEAAPALGARTRAALARELRAFFRAWDAGGWGEGGRGGGGGWEESDANANANSNAHSNSNALRFAVNEAPVLTGVRPDGRLTLSQQGVARGLASVQLELSLRLRRALVADDDAARMFARAVVDAWEDATRGVSGGDFALLAAKREPREDFA